MSMQEVLSFNDGSLTKTEKKPSKVELTEMN